MEINQPGSHIDHMLRQTRMHNMQLSTMADMKANLLLTISSLVLGLSLTNLATRPNDLVFMILATTSVLSITLAIYATMPKAGPISLRACKPDTKSTAFTLLFFGDYARLDYDEFEREMEEVINSPSLTYQVQVKELYNLGLYLGKHKYKMLRCAYLVFLVGVLVAFCFACLR